MEQQPVVYLHAGERLELAVVTVGDVVGTTDWLPVVGTDDVTAGGDGLDTLSGVGDLGVALPPGKLNSIGIPANIIFATSLFTFLILKIHILDD